MDLDDFHRDCNSSETEFPLVSAVGCELAKEEVQTTEENIVTTESSVELLKEQKITKRMTEKSTVAWVYESPTKKPAVTKPVTKPAVVKPPVAKPTVVQPPVEKPAAQVSTEPPGVQKPTEKEIEKRTEKPAQLVDEKPVEIIKYENEGIGET